MTKFQALYVLYLRHESMCGCSWRELDRRYRDRYGGKLIATNQLNGMKLEECAFRLLRPEPLFVEEFDLFECDLTLIEANIKNHLDYGQN